MPLHKPVLGFTFVGGVKLRTEAQYLVFQKLFGAM